MKLKQFSKRGPLSFHRVNRFMVVVAISVCACYFPSSCSSVPTGKIRYINKQTGEKTEKGGRRTQRQIQARPYLFGLIPMFWTIWKNELTRIEKIFEDIKAPVKLLNQVSLWAAIICGVASIALQTPGLQQILHRAAIACGLAYGATVALLFIFGFMVQFWWILLILILVALSFVLKEQGYDISRLWNKKEPEDARP